MTDSPADDITCPHCGAREVGGEKGCKELFQEVVGREFSQAELFQVHRLTVDAYSLQHPDQYMKSAKSAAAHLAGMCWAMEGKHDPSVSVALSRFLDGTPNLLRPDPVPPPRERGNRTVVDVYLAPDSGEHIARVKDWAREVWDAWADHHGQARRWLEEARGTQRNA
ncbi:MAG: hypothetical protein KJN92_00405 [Gemmatimonadetes bacterium]|nr:hypothetical protein [Gemmatimonadota bacterium]